MLDTSDSMEVSFDRLITSRGFVRSPVDAARSIWNSESSFFGRIAGDAKLGVDDDCFMLEAVLSASLDVLASWLLCLE